MGINNNNYKNAGKKIDDSSSSNKPACWTCGSTEHKRYQCPTFKRQQQQYRGRGKPNNPRNKSPNRESSPSSAPGGPAAEGHSNPGRKLGTIMISRNSFDILNNDAEGKTNKDGKDEAVKGIKLITGSKSYKDVLCSGILKKTSQSRLNDTMNKVKLGIDSHASVSVCNDKRLFSSLERCTPMEAEVANSEIIVSNQKGTIPLQVKNHDNTATVNMELKDVYYHQSYSDTLISWCSLKDSEPGWNLISNKNGSHIITPKNDKIILVEEGKVLKLCATSPNLNGPRKLCSARGKAKYSKVDDLIRLHEKLSHMGFDQMIKLIKTGTKVIEDMGELNMSKEQIDTAREKILKCTACTEGKGKKPAWGHSGLDRGSEPLETFYVDTFYVKDTKGDKYTGLVIVDPHLEKMWFDYTSTKDEITKLLIDKIALIETQINRKVKHLKRLHTDGGTELVNKQLKDACKAKGTELYLSPPDTQSLNGIAEAAVETMENGIRTLLSRCGLPDVSYWKFAAKHIEYVWNRTHVATATEKTPYEMLMGSKPSIGYLGIFGCDVYVWIPKEKRRHGTFKKKMIPGIYLGHSKVYNCPAVELLESRKIIYTRNVDFRVFSFIHAKALRSGSRKVIEDICNKNYVPVQYSSDDEEVNVAVSDGMESKHVTFDDVEVAEEDKEKYPGPDRVDEDGSKSYEVERILCDENRKGKKHYLIKWVGWPEYKSTWVTKDALDNCPEKLNEYNEQIKADKVIKANNARSTAVASRTRRATRATRTDHESNKGESKEDDEAEPDTEEKESVKDVEEKKSDNNTTADSITSPSTHISDAADENDTDDDIDNTTLDKLKETVASIMTEYRKVLRESERRHRYTNDL